MDLHMARVVNEPIELWPTSYAKNSHFGFRSVADTRKPRLYVSKV